MDIDSERKGDSSKHVFLNGLEVLSTTCTLVKTNVEHLINYLASFDSGKLLHLYTYSWRIPKVYHYSRTVKFCICVVKFSNFKAYVIQLATYIYNEVLIFRNCQRWSTPRNKDYLSLHSRDCEQTHSSRKLYWNIQRNCSSQMFEYGHNKQCSISAFSYWNYWFDSRNM